MSKITCPRDKATGPCVARDGRIGLDGDVCAGCGENPVALIAELAEDYAPARDGGSEFPQPAADRFHNLLAGRALS